MVPTRRIEGALIVLDEYSTKLNIATDRLMQQISFKKAQGYTIVVFRHHLVILMESDEAVMLDTDAGRLVKDWASKELVEKIDGRLG